MVATATSKAMATRLTYQNSLRSTATDVVSALQPIFCLFWLIRSFVGPTLAAFIACGPLQFLISHESFSSYE